MPRSFVAPLEPAVELEQLKRRHAGLEQQREAEAQAHRVAVAELELRFRARFTDAEALAKAAIHDKEEAQAVLAAALSGQRGGGGGECGGGGVSGAGEGEGRGDDQRAGQREGGGDTGQAQVAALQAELRLALERGSREAADAAKFETIADKAASQVAARDADVAELQATVSRIGAELEAQRREGEQALLRSEQVESSLVANEQTQRLELEQLREGAAGERAGRSQQVDAISELHAVLQAEAAERQLSEDGLRDEIVRVRAQRDDSAARAEQLELEGSALRLDAARLGSEAMRLQERVSDMLVLAEENTELRVQVEGCRAREQERGDGEQLVQKQLVSQLLLNHLKLDVGEEDGSLRVLASLLEWDDLALAAVGLAEFRSDWEQSVGAAHLQAVETASSIDTLSSAWSSFLDKG